MSTSRSSVPDVAQVPPHSRAHASSHRPPSRLSGSATHPPMLVSPQLPTQASQQPSTQSPAHISTTLVTLCTQQPPYTTMQYQPYLTTTAGSMARPSRPRSRPQPYTALTNRPIVQSATNLDTTQAASSPAVHVVTDSPTKRPVSACTTSSIVPPTATQVKRK